jgi:hypothetical protein
MAIYLRLLTFVSLKYRVRGLTANALPTGTLDAIAEYGVTTVAQYQCPFASDPGQSEFNCVGGEIMTKEQLP